MAGQDLFWEINQYNANDLNTPLEFGPFTATPVVPAEGTDEIASLNITKNTTSAGLFTIEVVLKDAQGEEGAGSLYPLASACTFNVEIEAPCAQGRAWIFKTNDSPGPVIDSYATFSFVDGGSYANADQEIIIDNLEPYNESTAGIYSYCSQEADGNIQPGELRESGPYKSSRVQWLIPEQGWSEPAYVQYYEPGLGGTARVKMRPSGVINNVPQTGINWDNVVPGAPIRFYTGKGLVTWTNQIGTQCGGVYNFNVLINMTALPSTPPNFLDLNVTSQFPNSGPCFAQSFTQCLTPLCPTGGPGEFDYQYNQSFQGGFGGAGGGGNSCGSTLGSVFCT